MIKFKMISTNNQRF